MSQQPVPKPMTLTGKILLNHAIDPPNAWVEAKDMLRIKVDWTIASELAFNGMNRTYEQLDRPRLFNSDRFYLAIDHTVDPTTLAKDARTQKLAQLSRDFAKAQNLKYFYDANVTIMHTTFYRDLVCPGDVVLGADSHTSSHGGMGAFAIGLGGADVTIAMVLGETWIEVPEAIAVEYRGTLPFGLTGKDIILKTLGDLGRNTVAMERTVEFIGDAARKFSTDMRFTICNMTAEFGGLNGIFEPDGVVAQALMRRPGHNKGVYFRADDNAPYVARYPINLEQLVPQVARPFSPDNVCPIDDVEDIPLQGVFIGACTTTEEELILSALVLERMLESGQQPVTSDNRLVVPGNLDIANKLKETGLLSVYERAGFRVGPPGCSMCLGIASDRAKEGENWLSSQNRNFENRMGKGSIAWLSSAPTVAASALRLRISDARPWLDQIDRARWDKLVGDTTQTVPEIRFGQPEPHTAPTSQGLPALNMANFSQPAASEKLTGRVQRFGSHVDTDAIIPGEFCHLVDAKELGKVCFRHVRPEFYERAQSGRTIVVAEEAWGSGSSREQAVWALQGAGVVAVIARSYAFIHKRNLVNEALPCFVMRDPAFYEAVKEDSALEIDVDSGAILVASTGKIYMAEAPSGMAQALARDGGIVSVVKRFGRESFAYIYSSH